MHTSALAMPLSPGYYWKTQAHAIRRELKRFWYSTKIKHNKIVVCGNNKTGTTSLADFFHSLGYRVAPQEEIEQIYYRNFRQPEVVCDLLDHYIQRYEVFQDVPFSVSDYLPFIANRYPDFQYIYTMRDPLPWYNSLLGHHSSTSGFQINKESPVYTIRSLDEAIRALREWSYHSASMLEHVSYRFSLASDLQIYDYDIFTKYHQNHFLNAKRILNSFNSLFVDITTDPDSSLKLCQYLGFPSGTVVPIPHSNKRRY